MMSSTPDASRPAADSIIDSSEIIDELLSTWRSVATLAASLQTEDWNKPTDLAGWTVKDLVSHMASIEAMLLGRDEPEHEAPGGEHVRNPLSAWNEQRVDRRRSWDPSEVLAEFESTTREREAVLRALTPEELAEVIASPLGVMELHRFLQMRLLDSWLHEQDMRRAVGSPETIDTASAARVLDMVLGWLPRAAANARLGEGTGAVIEVTGPVSRRVGAVVRGDRGVAVGSVDGERVLIRGGTGPLLRTATGRIAAAEAIESGLIEVEGDGALAERLLIKLNRVP